MAFLRTANAIVVHPRTTQSGWSKVRTAARIAGQPSHSLVEQASEILGRTFDPKDYLLSHCTLVASVDVETVHGVKLGSVREGSRTINRKYADYRITAATDQFINNNLDAFAREVLLKSYRTLIGGQNYCFVPGTPVLMADGTYKPIEEIRVGDEVLSHTGSARKVVHTFDREVDESICAIRLNHHKDRILTTGNHPFAAIDVTTGSVSPRKGSKPRSTIRYYHDQVTRGLRGDSHHLSQFEAKFGWRNANQITTGTHLLGPSHQCGANTGDIDRAILLGYYLAEGCQYTPASSPAESKGVVISPGIHERAVVDDILVRCARAFPDTKVSVKASHSSTWRVELRGMEIGAWMLEHGGQYSESKRMSREVLSWSTEALSYVLASWLNGDGNFHSQSSRLRGNTASPALGQQMAYIAEICGVRAALTFCEVKNKGQVSGQVKMVVGGRDVSYDVIPKHDTWLLTVSKDSIPLLASKTIRWKGFVPRVSKRSDLFQWGDRRVRTVASNESIPYAGHVYNIEVEVDNSYVIAPGIAVHNCEHVQVEDLSKGRIIDAVARDIGDSIYVDILVATDRKHTQLVKDIEEDRLTTLSMGCFLPGTMVSMSDGTRVPIESIQPGDMVLTHKGRAREVQNLQIRGGQWDVRRIRARGIPNEIVATDIHPFFVYRAPECCACGCGETLPNYAANTRTKHTTRLMTRRFKKGHDKRVFNPNGVYSLDEHRRRRDQMDSIKALQMVEVKAADLKTTDFLCFPRAEVQEIGLGATVGRARLLGYFLAEGSFLKYKGTPTEVQFNFSMAEKDTFVSEVMDLLRVEFPESNPPWVQERPDRDTCVVHISGRDVAAWFFQHGGEYSHRKRISPEVMSWPPEMHKHLLGTWLNGDGHLHSIHGSTSGTTTSYDLACQMHMLMARVGVYARMECNIAGRAVDVRQVVNGGIVVRDEVSGKLPAFTLTAGQSDAQPLGAYCAKVVADPTFAGRELRVLDDVVMFPITSIVSDTYEGWVFDMEVEEDHSYVVEGVAVHNCSVEHTTCTKCGNVAVDETELCDCVKYSKGNVFLDERGHRHRIAELCGHPSEDPTGGVTFIEASWVANPAFTGAVMRNIITPESLSPKMAQQMQSVLSSPPPQWVVSGNQKAASTDMNGTPSVVGKVSERRTAFDFGEGGAEGEEAKTPEAKPSPFDELEDRILQTVMDRIETKVRDEISKKDKPAATPEQSTAAPNDNLQASKVARTVYAAAASAMVKTASSHADLLNKIAILDSSYGLNVPVDIYRAVLAVGPMNRHASTESFLTACRGTLGRTLGYSEGRALLRLGRILNQAEGNTNRKVTPR